jgi:hypothetical protein
VFSEIKFLNATGNTECSYDRQVLIESKLMILRKVWRYQVLIQRTYEIRDRPFNLKGGGGMVFCFVQKFYFGQHKSYNIYCFCRAKREIFFQNVTLGYKTIFELKLGIFKLFLRSWASTLLILAYRSCTQCSL